MITLLTAAAAWGCTSAGSWADLVHPSHEPAPPDTIVVVAEFDMDMDPTILDGSGAPVPATVVTHAGDRGLYKVLLPVDPLVPGTYTVTTDQYGGEESFEIVDGDAPAVDPPVPVLRELFSDLTVTYDPCGYGASRYSKLEVRLCGDAPLYAVAEGPSEPPPPDLTTPGDFWLSSWDEPDMADVLGVHAGWTGTLWYGSFDAAGRFSGWTGPDPVEMPPATYGTIERMPDAEGGDGTTPTSFTSCPTFTAWELDEELHCPTVDGTPACAPAGDAPPGTEPAEGRGCATVGAPALPASALLLAVLGLRRRPRTR